MNGGGGDFPFSDIFDFFTAATGGGAGQRGPTPRSRRGQDALLRVTITLEEATFGVTKDIEVDTAVVCQTCHGTCSAPGTGDRKSTRLNSSHVAISYAVFCLKIK